MMAALDGELSAAERATYDAHLAACPACATQAAGLERLHRALGALPGRAHVPSGLEQATLRRVRAALSQPPARAGWRESLRAWWWLPVPAVATAALVLALRDTATPPSAAPPTSAPIAQAPAEPTRMAARPAEPARPAPPRAPREEATSERAPAPPPVVAARAELFLDLPVLEHMEKLQNYEDIRTVDLDNGGDQKG